MTPFKHWWVFDPVKIFVIIIIIIVIIIIIIIIIIIMVVLKEGPKRSTAFWTYCWER